MPINRQRLLNKYHVTDRIISNFCEPKKLDEHHSIFKHQIGNDGYKKLLNDRKNSVIEFYKSHDYSLVTTAIEWNCEPKFLSKLLKKWGLPVDMTDKSNSRIESSKKEIIEFYQKTGLIGMTLKKYSIQCDQFYYFFKKWGIKIVKKPRGKNKENL